MTFLFLLKFNSLNKIVLFIYIYKNLRISLLSLLIIKILMLCKVDPKNSIKLPTKRIV